MYSKDFTLIPWTPFWRRWETYLGKDTRTSYDEMGRILTVTLPSRPHDFVRGRITSDTQDEIASMGCRNEITPTTNALVKTGRSAKEPDASYIPSSLPAGRSENWPSFVIEVGYSESSVKLRTDAAWWIVQSNGDVRAALTIHISPRRPAILYELHQPSVQTRRTDVRYYGQKSPRRSRLPGRTMPQWPTLPLRFRLLRCFSATLLGHKSTT